MSDRTFRAGTDCLLRQRHSDIFVSAHYRPAMQKRLLLVPLVPILVSAQSTPPHVVLPGGPPAVSSVLNLASGQDSLSPGVLAAIFGNNLDLQQPSTVPLSVLLNGQSAALLSRSPQQLTVQLPVQSQPGTATLMVGLQGMFTSFLVRLQNFAPGIFASTGTIGQISHLNGSPVNLTNPAQPGEALSLLAVGLGPTSPLISTGTPAPSAPIAVTITRPTIAVDGQNVLVQQAGLQPSSVGKYQVFFTAPANLSPGSHSLSLTIGGNTSNSVTLVTAGQGQPSIDAVVNAGSFAGSSIVPGSIVSIFGGQQDGSALFPATAFRGSSVKFNGILSPLFAVVPSSGQINAFVPTELSGLGVVNVQVVSSSGTSPVFQLQMAPTSPGFFRIPDPSRVVRNNAAALFANSAWLVLPPSLSIALQIPQNCSASGINLVSLCGQAAHIGDFLQIYATGLGKATVGGNPNGAPLATGTAAPASGNPLYKTIELPVVTIGDVPSQVVFSGLAPGFAGLYQINLQVPAGVPFGDQIPVRIIGANGLSDTSTIAIQP